VPLELKDDEVEKILFNNQTGIWLNKEECDAWKGRMPLSEYKLNEDPNPIIIRKKLMQPIEYNQNVQIRYLKPPTPPPHGDLIIKQENDIVQHEYVPPQIVRFTSTDEREITPPPIIIREKPPDLPRSLPTETITIPGKIIKSSSPPPRQIIIEHMPAIAKQPINKPQQIIIEKWLPYEKQKRKVIFEKSSDSTSKAAIKQTNLNLKTNCLNIDIEIPSSMRNKGLEIEIEYKLNKSALNNNYNNNKWSNINQSCCCENINYSTCSCWDHHHHHNHCCTTSKRTIIHSIPKKMPTIARYYSFSEIHDHLKKTLWE
jgi:hypothetical protein